MSNSTFIREDVTQHLGTKIFDTGVLIVGLGTATPKVYGIHGNVGVTIEAECRQVQVDRLKGASFVGGKRIEKIEGRISASVSDLFEIPSDELHKFQINLCEIVNNTISRTQTLAYSEYLDVALFASDDRVYVLRDATNENGFLAASHRYVSHYSDLSKIPVEVYKLR